MQSEETASQEIMAGDVISITDFSTRKQACRERRQERMRTADSRFASLDELSQRNILVHAIGYMEAARDMIASGRRVRPDEVSRMIGYMEEMINESWEGGAKA